MKSKTMRIYQYLVGILAANISVAFWCFLTFKSFKTGKLTCLREPCGKTTESVKLLPYTQNQEQPHNSHALRAPSNYSKQYKELQLHANVRTKINVNISWAPPLVIHTFKILVHGFWRENEEQASFISKSTQFKDCEYSNCKILETHVNRWSPKEMAQSHALVLNAWNTYSVPATLQNLENSAKQLVIFYTHDAPCRSHWKNISHPKQKLNLDNLFDIVASYHRKADLYIPYGAVRKKVTQNRGPKLNEISSFERSGLALWIVNDCKTLSRRSVYVQELKKYIKIDVFGTCLNGSFIKRCSKRTAPFTYDVCSLQLIAQYKFSIAFEDTIAEDYITDAAYQALLIRTIPIVLGGANYSQLLPPNSFIDVAMFTSPKALAHHLKFLSRSKNDFMEYHKWRSDHELEYPVSRACQICKFLNDNYYLGSPFFDIVNGEKMNRTRLHITDYYGNMSTCVNTNYYYKTNWKNKTWRPDELELPEN